MTLKGELAHRVSLISISLSGQPSLCDNAARSIDAATIPSLCASRLEAGRDGASSTVS